MIKKSLNISLNFCLTILLSANIFAQNSDLADNKLNNIEGEIKKEFNIPKYRGKAIHWYDSLKEVRTLLNLEDLETSKKQSYIRIWSDKSAIDAWQDEYGNFYCRVTSFCKEYNEKKMIEGDMLKRSKNLENISGQILIDSLFSMKVCDIEDYNFNKKFNQNLIDGITYKVEISTPNSYKMFTILNPENQKRSIPEVKLFISYLKLISREVDLEKLHSELMMSVKQGTYVAGLEIITKKKGLLKVTRK